MFFKRYGGTFEAIEPIVIYKWKAFEGIVFIATCKLKIILSKCQCVVIVLRWYLFLIYYILIFIL